MRKKWPANSNSFFFTFSYTHTPTDDYFRYVYFQPSECFRPRSRKRFGWIRQDSVCSLMFCWLIGGGVYRTLYTLKIPPQRSWFIYLFYKGCEGKHSVSSPDSDCCGYRKVSAFASLPWSALGRSSSSSLYKPLNNVHPLNSSLISALAAVNLQPTWSRKGALTNLSRIHWSSQSCIAFFVLLDVCDERACIAVMPAAFPIPMFPNVCIRNLGPVTLLTQSKKVLFRYTRGFLVWDDRPWMTSGQPPPPIPPHQIIGALCPCNTQNPLNIVRRSGSIIIHLVVAAGFVIDYVLSLLLRDHQPLFMWSRLYSISGCYQRYTWYVWSSKKKDGGRTG